MDYVTEKNAVIEKNVKKSRLKFNMNKVTRYLIIVGLSAICVLPFLWMLSASLKAESEIFGFPIQWIPEVFYWSNYVEVWTRVPFHVFYLNSFKIALISTVLLLFTSSLGGYAFAKIKFPERDKIFFLYVATMMVPFQVMMIPQYMLMSKIGLVDSHWPIIIINSFSAFGVFLFRQFFVSIPDELLEAARIDGLSEFGIYFRIILPLSKPAIATLIIFQFMHAWNDFLAPLIYITSEELYTLTLGMQFFVYEFDTEYSLLMAAAVSAIIPTIIVYFLAQEQFIKGVSNTGVKG
ncbi:carbohydrate ABC transporter permease [Chengkuizengella axinellae]|uniref:Carbohydrate ABC transporter permease n=1 Tax=Chengkuizengella axinellae TaxID=3064388 RepID=A0ABT9IZI5_9BACL|nr:carbohydrate ABC transporter permease [Chengkuizengella sp. 2205SS18-9]MDP5274789.1 carbohydrate ABC transporter permease [Chengkuizengella sp. 2205SS18-9]